MSGTSTTKKPTVVILSGFPGKMSRLLREAILRCPDDFELANFAFTGPEITEDQDAASGISLVRPENRKLALADISYMRTEQKSTVVVADFSQPDAVNGNVEFFCENWIPFIMGTTGGDRIQLRRAVECSRTCAVIAPNMAAEVVALHATFQMAAKMFPGVFAGFEAAVVESHQKGKKDPSGTAISFMDSFARLGAPFTVEDIGMIRDPVVQQHLLGVPPEYLGGHGWHEYTLCAPDGSVRVGLFHNINGRAPYVAGALKALRFLSKKIELGIRGQAFDMLDVLKAG